MSRHRRTPERTFWTWPPRQTVNHVTEMAPGVALSNDGRIFALEREIESLRLQLDYETDRNDALQAQLEKNTRGPHHGPSEPTEEAGPEVCTDTLEDDDDSTIIFPCPAWARTDSPVTKSDPEKTEAALLN